MKIIERYVFGAFLSSFVLAFLVLSFVLTIGLLVQIVGLIMDGVPMSLVGEFCMVSLPETLQWSMPLALLVSSILVFSRLSADSEISAMRACGINLLTVLKWPVIFAVLCAILGFWVNNEVVPRGHEVRRTLKRKVSVETGLAVLEPGRVIDDFPKAKLYFDRKEGNWLYDLVVLDYSNPKFDRMITADKALVRQDGADIEFELYRMTVDPVDEKHRTMARANRFVYTVPNAVKGSVYKKREKDFRFCEMLAKIRELRAQGERGSSFRVGTADAGKGGSERRSIEKMRDDVLQVASKFKVELSKRFVFAMASICFVLVGMPLGIRSQRKESTVGMALSLAVSLGYYVIVILMLSCSRMHHVHPEVLIWAPVVICFVLAAWLTRRHL